MFANAQLNWATENSRKKSPHDLNDLRYTYQPGDNPSAGIHHNGGVRNERVRKANAQTGQ